MGRESETAMSHRNKTYKYPVDYAPLILNTNLIKPGSKIGYPYDSIWDCLDWEPIVIITTLCTTANEESLIYPSIKSWINPGQHFTSLRLCKYSQILHLSPSINSQ